jgi:D-glycero-alpha-D-manno-heptose-7-phosphate kinase
MARVVGRAEEQPVSRAVRAVAPCRADLAGGTLDIWPLGLLFAGARTVNVALDLRVEVTLAHRSSGYLLSTELATVEAATVEELAAQPDAALVAVAAAALELPPVSIGLRSASPRGGGLGASSAVTVALIAAADRLLGRPAREPAASARLARDIEARLMRLPTGMQDHYAALLGGALAIRFAPGGEVVDRPRLDLAELGARMLVVYSGQSHFSAATNWQIIRACLEGESVVGDLFRGIAQVAAELPGALERGEWQRAGELVGAEWQLRRQLAEGVSTPAVEGLLQVGRSLGAWGGKACGAGGGGCVVLLTPPERRPTIAEALEASGGQLIRAQPTSSGLQVDELPADAA